MNTNWTIFVLFLLIFLAVALTACGVSTYQVIYHRGEPTLLHKPSMTKCEKAYSTLTEDFVIDYYGSPCDVEVRKPNSKGK